jgi:hypothetical protein
MKPTCDRDICARSKKQTSHVLTLASKQMESHTAILKKLIFSEPTLWNGESENIIVVLQDICKMMKSSTFIPML